MCYDQTKSFFRAEFPLLKIFSRSSEFCSGVKSRFGEIPVFTKTEESLEASIYQGLRVIGDF
jgi:hypothetical protein